MAISCIIGHAVHDENGKASGGKLGDNNGSEVVKADWYLKKKEPWTAVMRAKTLAARERIAKAMEQAVANDNIGYDQGNRTSCYKLAKEANWDLSKVGLCETDCSALVAVCVNAAGIEVSKDMYTGNELSVISATGKFEIFKDDAHCLNADQLLRGDILLKSGHTAIVLNVIDSTSKSTIISSPAPETKDEQLKGSYKVTADALNMRNGAGTKNTVMVVLPNDAIVTCQGLYKTVSGVKWLYCEYVTKSKIYQGYCSENYLDKQLNTVVATTKPLGKSPVYAGEYVVMEALNLRNGAGSGSKILTVLPKFATVTCDGSYGVNGSTKWFVVSYSDGKMQYTGFVSSLFVKKK